MESDAMTKIYKKYHNELYFYALNLCRKEDLAKDLVSESFFRAFISSNQPKAEESFKYWLFRILKNHYIDLVRKERESLTLDTHKKFTPDDTAIEPAKNYIEKERNQYLYKHLMTLEPIVYREVIYLYYYVEMSIKEISIVINRTETNTKTILYRARKKLGKLLKEDSYDFQR